MPENNTDVTASLAAIYAKSHLSRQDIANITALTGVKVMSDLGEGVRAKQINRKFTPGIDAGDKPIGGKNLVNKEIEELEYSSFKNFLRDVRNAGSDGSYQSDELRNYSKKAAGLMEEGDLAQGGYLVPTEAANQILEKSLEMSIVRPRATIQPMSSNKLEIPADMDENHSTNYFSGITIYRTGEGDQKTAKNPVLGKISLQLHKLTGYCEVTDELLEDAPALESWLIRKFSQSVAFVEDSDYLQGTGVNQALGMFNSANPSLITVTKETGQAADTIVTNNIFSMWERLYPDGQARAVWIAQIDTFKQLATLTMPVGTGGIPVFLPSQQMAGRPYRELMGCPLFYSEKMATLGDAGDIGLCDISQYIIGEKRGGLQVASSIHVKFDYDRTAFRFVLRYDGRPSWLTTLTPKVGSNTLSPFIILGERA